MHRFTPTWPDDLADWDPPDFMDGVYRDARDVIENGSYDPVTVWYTYPWLWHLDESGRPHCSSKASSFTDVQVFAKEIERALACRTTAVEGVCPDYWFIIESRKHWLSGRDDVNEADVAAFVSLRRSLGDFGITLLDDIIVNERYEWWSLHELTSGSTAWDFSPSHATRDLAELDLGEGLGSGFELPRRGRRRSA